jgi:hypothetical protein
MSYKDYILMPYGNKKLKRISELRFMIFKVYDENLAKFYIKIIYFFHISTDIISDSLNSFM